MNKTITTCLLTATFLFYSRKKSGNNNVAAPSAKTQWTIAGNTYFGLSTVFDTDTAELDLLSTGSLGNYLDIVFHTRPVKHGTYDVVLGNATFPSQLGADQCDVGALIMNNGNRYYVSTYL
jgi:hypothetical protein